MNEPQDALLEALRADLPSRAERERMRARLIAAGVLAVAATPSATLAASGSVPAPVATGLAPKLAALPWASKLAIVAALSAGVATPVVVTVRSAQTSQPAQSSARRAARVTHERAVPAESSARRGDLAAPQAPAQGRADASSSVQPQGSHAPEATGQVDTAQARAAAPAYRAPRVPAGGPAGVRERTSEAVAAATSPVAEAPASAAERSAAQATSLASQQQPGTTARSVSSQLAARALPLEPAAAQAAPSEPVATRAESPESRDPQPTAAEGVKFYVPLRKPSLMPLTSASSQLERETQLMERALGALRMRNETAARAYLEQHAQQFPDGMLRRDRERVLARILH